MHTILRTKAQAISDHLIKTYKYAPGVVGASPFLDMLMELLQQLMPMLIGCFASPKEAVDAAQNGLNFFQRFRLRQAVRRYLDDAEMSSRMAAQLADAIEKVGAATTEEEATALFQAA